MVSQFVYSIPQDPSGDAIIVRPPHYTKDRLLLI